MNKSTSLLIAILLLLSGCLATPYQKAKYTGTLTGGYDEKMLPGEKPRYAISFIGNGATSLEVATEYWYKRADELCLDGYEVERLRAITAEGEIAFESYAFVGDALISIPGKTKTSSPNVFGEVACK